MAGMLFVFRTSSLERRGVVGVGLFLVFIFRTISRRDSNTPDIAARGRRGAFEADPPPPPPPPPGLPEDGGAAGPAGPPPCAPLLPAGLYGGPLRGRKLKSCEKSIREEEDARKSPAAAAAAAVA
ncbi:hypothetical protein EYF80_028680 [Liparis tanakae]|uniref:Uncharacterized protein n=1 Tax=Liparis tanakae TaxID=230148 RepID=A0A4Z2H8S8_9TELE|nr:hypothetical protein EYF80_028680 [Liparis tanakae]